MIEHRGDVFHADFTEYSGFDFLVGGSPCTYWSIAQKNNRETEASGMGWELFSQYVRALREAQPMWFIYENNKSMSNAIRESITETFGFEPICINSALVSAQNRQRLYWVGKRNPDGTYSRVKVEQPQDRGILLRDALDYQPFGDTNGKSFALTASYWKGQPKERILEKSQRTHVAEPCRVGTYPNEAKNQAHDSQQYRIYSTEAKGVTLCGNGGGMGAKTGLYAIPVAFDGDVPIKAVSLADGKTYTVYEVKDGQITIKGKQYPIKLADGFYIIRKLTVSECKRLQTVPEWYEFPVSDTQAYKMLGNGWTVEVIVHLINATQSGGLDEQQLSLFEMAVNL
jgi:DNA (cytosine-5)-methyltransferase 3A